MDDKNIKVIKRDGRIVGFSCEKMKRAIYGAMENTESGVDSKIAQAIVDKFASKENGKVSVEVIQDFVENELMKSKRKDVAREYIKRRHERDIAREAKTKDIFMSIVNTANNDVTRENANMNSDSPAGMMMKFASETTKPFTDNYLLFEDTRNAVKGNYIHVHDKDYYPTKSLTCLQHPLDRILKNGFMAGHGEGRGLKRRAYKPQYPWRPCRTRCTEDRRYQLSTSTLPHTSRRHTRRNCRMPTK